MNRFYRLVWNEAKQCFVPIPETSQKRGKRKGSAFASVAALALATASGALGPAQAQVAPGALPTGGQVVAGQATISQGGAQQTITQTSASAAINWQSFNIGADGKVVFVQPNAQSITLNRVVGGDPSQIYGSLQANGQVFLINPNGVLFARGAQVNTAGLLASTRDISVADFMAGRYKLAGSGTGTVVNKGALTADGGYVVLVGAQVVNDGAITAQHGAIDLAAANEVTLKIDQGGLADLTIDQGGFDALVANHGVIRADGGRVYLTADALDQITKTSVNNDGLIEARSLASQDGKIVLRGDAATGSTHVAGTLDASSADGQGGRIVVTGHDVTLGDGALLTAAGATGGGQVLVGGGWQGQDASIPNAASVMVAPTATLDVSATTRGDAGTAVLWSQDHTGFFGKILAKGGALGGAGGKVETSSHDVLDVLGAVDASATSGPGGQWLLDPRNVTIAASGASGTAYSANFNPSADSTILASAINASLNGGTSVTITTGSTGTSNGDITVNANILQSTYPSNGYTTLSLLAAGDININNQISSTQGRLNVVLTADSDVSGAGNINFGSGGKILTNGGNFYAGNLTSSSTANANQKRGLNFTMAAGSLIDVADGSGFGYGGMLDIAVNGTMTLAANSLRNTPYYTGTTYYNNGASASDNSPYIGVSAGAILSTNTNAATADIKTVVGTTLRADTGNIGAANNAIKISANGSRAYNQLNVTNTGGDSYVNEVGSQAFATINLSVGSQLNSTHDLQIMGDAGGDGATGAGHMRVTTDGAGVVQVAANGIRTGGDPDLSVGATNVVLSGGAINFASGSTDTGTANFTANATTMTGSQDNIADITAPNVTLNGQDIGTSGHAIELADNTVNDPDYGRSGYLYVTNTGGSTFLKSVNDGFVSITMSHLKAVGTHSLLFSGGEHLDYTTTATGILTHTISGGPSDGVTFGDTTGIDLSRSLRSLNLTSLNGDIIFGDTSVDMGQGYFTATIPEGNSVGVIAAENSYDSAHPMAQITSGDVTFSVQNRSTPGVTTIGAGGKDIQIAKGAGTYSLAGYSWDPTLSVATQIGDVFIHELTQNGFKSISVSLGQANAAQTISIDLKGADDISFTDTGSLITVDAAKVAVSDFNRNFSLSAGDRVVQTDGNAFTTGSYSVSARQMKLNGDIITNGGDINLGGTYGVDLLQSIRVDSNSDRLGHGGNVSLGTSSSAPYNGTISSTGGSRTLSLNASSTDAYAGQISFGGDVDNRAGAYLAGLSFDSTSVGSGQGLGADTYLGINSSSILLNGDFSAAGNVYLGSSQSPFALRTAVSNGATAGSITFGGDNLYHDPTQSLTFNASTSATNGVGGNVDLYTSDASVALAGSSVSVTAAGGSGGVTGAVTLGAVTTSGGQSYTGSLVKLHGDLTSGGAMTLGGAARLQNSVTLKSGAGTMTLNGGVSATAAGQNLTIGSTSDSAALALSADNSGGAYVNTLTVVSATNRAVTLGAIGTEDAQTYTGGAVTVGGAITTNGGDVSLSGVTSLATSGSTVSIDTDRVGGSNAAGRLLLGSRVLNGTGPLNIDTTADGGGANAALSMAGAGSTTAFSSINIKAGAVTLSGTAKASGDITIEAHGAAADLTLTSAGKVQTTGTANTIVLATDRNFLNSATSNSGIAVAAGSRYLVYSANPAGSTEGMTGYGKHYNQTYTAGATPSYAGSGNWFLYSVAPVISVTTNGTSVVYGANDPSLALTSANYSGFIDGDTLASTSGSQTLSLQSGTLSGAGKRAAGDYAYTLNGTLTDSLGYQYAALNQTLTVTRQALTVTGLTAVSREYDGTTNVAFTGTATVGAALSGDTVTVDASAITGAFVDKNAGTNKAVTVGGSAGLTGADAGNYTLSPPAGLTADITRKTLTVAGSTVTGKTYDGGTSATITAGTLSGLVGSETVWASGAGAFADKNAGTGKLIVTTYSLANGANGGLASNYALAGETLSGDIAKKTITVAATGQNKTYDGSTAVGVTLSSADLVNGDTVSFSGSAALLDKNAGLAKAVSVTGIAKTGTDAGNYAINTTASTTADVARKTITVAAQGQNRTYDGSTVVGVTLSSAGLVSGDAVDFSGSGALADKNAGLGKAVAVTGIAKTGTDAGNYDINTTASTTADVAKKAITVAAQGQSRTYDGSTAVGVTLASADVVSGDTVSFSGSAALLDKNAGMAKAVSVTGIGKSGTDAGNYTINTTASTTADIAKKAITITATGQNKTYDGSTSVGVTLSSADVLNGDTVAFSGAGALADKNAGMAKVVLVSGIAGSGTDAGNYAVNTTASTTADVARKTITVAAQGQNRTYDGSTVVGVTLSSAGLVSGDAVDFSGSGALADKNAGLGKAVAVIGIAKTGTDAGNYDINTTASTTADVAKKAITVAAQGQNRTYDGSKAVGVTLASADVVSGDTVSFSGSAALLDKNAGLAKAVSVTGIGKSGTDAGNYTINTTASTTADIAKKAITITATGQNKTYDGSTAISVDLTGEGVVTGDAVAFSGTGALADKNAGSAKIVTVTSVALSGVDAGNYAATSSTTTTADVAQKAITVALQGPISKTADGATQVTLTSANYLVSGTVTGEVINVTQGMGLFADSLAGRDKTVTATLAGADYAAGAGTLLGNYQLFSGTISGPLGEIVAPATPAYQAAVSNTASNPVSSPSAPVFSVLIGQNGPAVSTGDGDNSVSTQSDTAQGQGGVASVQSRDTLAFRRTFSIADGGIRLPSGVNDTDGQ